MTYTIEVSDATELDEAVYSGLITAAEATLALEPVAENVALTIFLTDDDHIRAMNRRYRGEDNSTDVLSFPIGDPLPLGDELKIYLGDIAISLSTAERQAQVKKHSVLGELQLLTVHGVLHLLGYDHDEPAAKEAMWTAQKKVLEHLGLGMIQPTEEDHVS